MRSAEMAVVGAASKAGHHSAAQVDAMPKQAQPPGQRHGLAVYVDSTSMVIVTSSPAAIASPVSTSAAWICRDHALTVLDGGMEQNLHSAGRPGRAGLIFSPVTAAEISSLFTLCSALWFRSSLACAAGRRSFQLPPKSQQVNILTTSTVSERVGFIPVLSETAVGEDGSLFGWGSLADDRSPELIE